MAYTSPTQRRSGVTKGIQESSHESPKADAWTIFSPWRVREPDFATKQVAEDRGEGVSLTV